MRRQPPGSYRGYRQPGIRLVEPVITELAAHRGDRALPILYGVHRFDKAHLVALAEAGFVSVDDAQQMAETLDAVEREGVDQARRQAGGGIHSGEYLLIQRLGEDIGGQLALGRSSADIGAVALRILVRDRLLVLMDRLLDTRRALASVAQSHTTTVIAARTQGHPAQATTVGHILAGWASVLERHHQRLSQSWSRVNQSPAGAAMLVGSSFVLDRHRLARRLGFDGVLESTYDATQHHDHVLEALADLALLGADLSRWSDDLSLWSAPDQALVHIPDRFCGTSSVLPQAKHAYLPQLVKAVGAQAAGALVSAFMVDRAASGSAVLERQGVNTELGNLIELTSRNLTWWAQLLPELRWDTAACAAAASDHFVAATEVAGLLVRQHGQSWRSAHQIVALAVRLACAGGGGDVSLPRPSSPLSSELLDQAALEYQGAALNVDAAALRSALDPAVAVAARQGVGGPAPDQVDALLRRLRGGISEDAAELQARRATLTVAADDLAQAWSGLRSKAGVRSVKGGKDEHPSPRRSFTDLADLHPSLSSDPYERRLPRV